MTFEATTLVSPKDSAHCIHMAVFVIGGRHYWICGLNPSTEVVCSSCRV